MARASTRRGGQRAASRSRRLALPRRSRGHLGVARARTVRSGRDGAGLVRRGAHPARPLPRGARLSDQGRRAVALDGRGGDPPRRAHARPRRLAGGAAARRRAWQRRQPLARVQLGVAGDDARRRRHVSGRAPSAGGQPGPSPPTVFGANGAATCGSRTSTDAARTSSVRRTGSRATSTSSHAATCSTTSGVRRSRPGPSRRSTSTRCAPPGSRSGVLRSSRAASHAARSGVTARRASSHRSPPSRPGTTPSPSCSSPVAS